MRREVNSFLISNGHYPEQSQELNFNIESSDDLAFNIEELSEWAGSFSENFVRLTAKSQADFLLKIKSGKDGGVFLNANKILEGPTNKEQALALAKFGIILGLLKGQRIQTGLDALRKLITDESEFPSILNQTILCLPFIAEIYARMNRAPEALLLAKLLFENGFTNAALNFSVSLVISPKPDLSFLKEYQNFLTYMVESSKISEPRQKAAIFYSLANSFRSVPNCRAAISNYLKAAELDRSYKNRSYFYAELGGCFFLTKKFTWSECAYRMADRLGEQNIPVKGLLGEAILFQGRVEESHSFFEEALKSSKKPNANFVLKAWLSGVFLKPYYGSEPDLVRSSSLCEAAHKMPTGIEQKRILEESIKLNPLNGLAWFNLAACKVRLGETATNEWIAVCVIQDRDLEAWTNAILSIPDQAQKGILETSVIVEAFRLHGPALLNEIISRSPDDQKEPAREHAQELGKIAAKLLADFDSKPPFLMRVVTPE